MKKLLALLLAVCCMLGALPVSRAETLEQQLIRQLPQLLMQAADGFELNMEGMGETADITFASDAKGLPLLLWELPDEKGGLKLETVLEALVCAAAGVDSLPDGPAAELDFAAQAVQAIAQAARSAVTVEQTTQTQPSGLVQKHTAITLSPKKLASAVDTAVQAQILLHADKIDQLLTRYDAVITSMLPQSAGVRSAQALLEAWNGLGVSKLIVLDMPVEVSIITLPDGTGPWNAEAKFAGITLNAEYTGEYFTAALNAWDRVYVFDSRDLQKAWVILSAALEGISSRAYDVSFAEGDYRLMFSPQQFMSELRQQLVASTRRYDQYTGELLARYMPWFGVEETDLSRLKERFYHELSYLGSRVTLPTVEAGLHMDEGVFELDFVLGNKASHVYLRKNTVDICIPMNYTTIAVTGFVSEKALSLSGTVGNKFAIEGRRKDGQWEMDLYTGDRHVATAVVSDGYASGYLIDAPYDILTLQWDERTLHALISDSTLHATVQLEDRGVNWTVYSEPFDLTGRCSWDGAFTLETELGQKQKYSWRGYRQDWKNTWKCELEITGQSVAAKYIDSRPSDGKYRLYSAQVDWSEEQPCLLLQCVRQIWPYESAFDNILFAVDYRPQTLVIQNDYDELVFTTAADGEIRWMSNGDSWALAPVFTDDGCRVKLTCNDESVVFDLKYRQQQLTDSQIEEHGVKLMNVHDVLVWLGFAKPEPEWRQGSATGFAGPVTVRVQLDGSGAITAIEIGDEYFSETPGFGAKAQEDAFKLQFIGKKLPVSEAEIDAIAGATITTRAVISALNAIAAPGAMPAEKPAAAEQASNREDGTFTGSARGFAGPVAVEITVEGNAITAITIGDESFAETAGFGAQALEEAFRQQFIGLTLPVSLEDIDAIAGATITSQAVIEAINTAE
ncbi:MAG: FMN-binding protein [Clostridia bacterium]|nr:FMN-binding protein [Clostridia bacterium]